MPSPTRTEDGAQPEAPVCAWLRREEARAARAPKTTDEALAAMIFRPLPHDFGGLNRLFRARLEGAPAEGNVKDLLDALAADDSPLSEMTDTPVFVKADDADAFEAVVGEIRDEGEGFIESEVCKGVIRKICRYFAIEEEGAGIHVAWCRQKGGKAEQRFAQENKAFGRGSRDHNCTASVCVGSLREMAFQRNKTGELVYFEVGIRDRRAHV